jgi:MraZ protein
MFRGQYDHTIDAKGRTSVPARYRDVLAATGDRRIVLTSALDPCVAAYTLAEWEVFETRLEGMPLFDEAVEKLRRIYVSGAVECEIDEVGRILVPSTLRSHARLRKDVRWAGLGRHAELWDIHEWKKQFEGSDDERRAIKRRLAELRL